MCVVIGYFVGHHPMRIFLLTVVRSRKIIQDRWVGHLWPGLFVHGGEAGFPHCFGWLADWSVQLHSHSESSCWLYNFPTFTCAQSNKRHAQIYITQCGWDLFCSSAMLSSYIYPLHFQALSSSDSENYINSVKLIETLRERECACVWCVCVGQTDYFV